MNSANYYMPTQIRFGQGKLEELPEVLGSFGKKGLLVSRPKDGSLRSVYARIFEMLGKSGIEMLHYDKVVPNPTTSLVDEGIQMATQNNVDFVLGVGGGSTLDAAKLIAFFKGYSEGNIDWAAAESKFDNPFAIGASPQNSLPFVAVTTTSGSGSQCTQAAVVSNVDEKSKVTLFHSGLFPKISIIDPELMSSVPASVTAASGFDVFAHAFESYLGSRTSPLTRSMSMQVIDAVFTALPRVVEHPEDMEARTKMAWADTLGGMCLANGGADLPHPLGEVIGGICPRISHGDTLAIVYPEFLKFRGVDAGKKFYQVESVLSKKRGDKSLSQHVNTLFEEINLNTALSRAKLSNEESQLMKDHPLLGILNPSQADGIRNIMVKSLEA